MKNMNEIIVVVIVLAIIIHMIYELFIRKAPKTLSVSDGRNDRRNAGLPPMTAREANEILNKISANYNNWTSFKDEYNRDMIVITKHSQAKKTRELLKEIVAAMPDDDAVIREYNELNKLYKSSTKRTYGASTTYIIISSIISVGLALISGTYEMIGLTAASVVLYIMASMTPTYLNDRKALKGNSGRLKFMSGLIAGIFGTLATAKTVTTITKWSDGTTTRDTDNSEVWGSLIITIVLLMILTVFMSVVALINYLRNYIFHF